MHSFWITFIFVCSIYIALKVYLKYLALKSGSNTPKCSPRRKVLMSIWKTPKEGNAYTRIDVEVTNALEYINKLKKESGTKITITHLVGKILGEVLNSVKSLNGRIVLNSFIPHSSVDISFLVSLENGKDLGQVKISNINKKSVLEIASEMNEETANLYNLKDKAQKNSQNFLKLMPVSLLKPFITLGGFLASGIGLNLKKFGLNKFPFGACIITNVGVFDIEEGFVPPTPFARVSTIFCIGAITEKPSVVNGKIKARKRIIITGTADHRYMDGSEMGKVIKIIRDFLTNPERLDK